LDINLLKTAIVSGETHKIQNNDKPNTLNIVIRRILSIKHQQELSNNALQFNLQFIKDLMDYGAKPWNRGDKESNTLTIALKRSTTYQISRIDQQNYGGKKCIGFIEFIG